LQISIYFFELLASKPIVAHITLTEDNRDLWFIGRWNSNTWLMIRKPLASNSNNRMKIFTVYTVYVFADYNEQIWSNSNRKEKALLLTERACMKEGSGMTIINPESVPSCMILWYYDIMIW
jgi:hypothetical protein